MSSHPPLLYRNPGAKKIHALEIFFQTQTLHSIILCEAVLVDAMMIW